MRYIKQQHQQAYQRIEHHQKEHTRLKNLIAHAADHKSRRLILVH